MLSILWLKAPKACSAIVSPSSVSAVGLATAVGQPSRKEGRCVFVCLRAMGREKVRRLDAWGGGI